MSTAIKTAVATPDRVTRCRYLSRHRDQCTGEAVDPDGEILLCQTHLGRAIELVRARMRETGITSAPKP